MPDCPYGHPKAKWDYQCRTCGWVDYQALVEDLIPSPPEESEKRMELDRQSFAAKVFILGRIVPVSPSFLTTTEFGTYPTFVLCFWERFAPLTPIFTQKAITAQQMRFFETAREDIRWRCPLHWFIEQRFLAWGIPLERLVIDSIQRWKGLLQEGGTSDGRR